jgi:NAD(P)H-dependent FMN reductase
MPQKTHWEQLLDILSTLDKGNVEASARAIRDLVEKAVGVTMFAGDWNANVPVAVMHALDGLYTDGAHHKQWHLEQTIRALGIDPAALDDREIGIAP